jgi:hypothetical protein
VNSHLSSMAIGIEGNVIELSRSVNLVSITMCKCVNGRLKPFRYSLLVLQQFNNGNDINLSRVKG